MSQIRLSIDDIDISHYSNSSAERQSISSTAPNEFTNAQPLPRSSSGWALAGRIALGILTLGTSELAQLAWKGIQSFITNALPAPNPEPILQGREGLPASAPDADQTNTALKAMLTSSSTNNLSAPYQEAVNTALSELRNNYGEDLVPHKNFGEILNSIDTNASNQLFSKIRFVDHALTPQELYDIIKTTLQPKLNMASFASYVKTITKTAGGLGGISNHILVEKLLGTPGNKNRKNLEEKESLEDVRRMAIEMGVRTTISDIKTAMNTAIQNVRDTFNNDILPESFDTIMNKKTKSDKTVRNEMNEQLQSDPKIGANKDDIKNVFTRILLDTIY